MPYGYFPRNNRVGELLGSGLSGFVQNYLAAKEGKRARGIEDEERARSRALQDYELSQRGLHLTKPGEMAPRSVFDSIAASVPVDSIVERSAQRPGAVPMDEVPVSASTPRPQGSDFLSTFQSMLGEDEPSAPRYQFGPGYYVDREEAAQNAAPAASAARKAAITDAFTKALPQYLISQGERQRKGEAFRSAGVPETAVPAVVESPGLAADYLFPKDQQGVNWQTVETDKGYVQINPRTGEQRPLGIGGYHQDPNARYNLQSAQRAMNLLGRYNADQTVKDAATIANAYNSIKTLGKDPSGASDIRLLYQYMKLLDPNSVVRESEFATAAKSGSLPQNIQAYASKVVNGERLTPEQRAAFIREAERQAVSSRQQLGQLNKRYSSFAQRNGIDPADVVYDPFEMAMEPASGSRNLPGLTPEQQARVKSDPEYRAFKESQGYTFP